MTKNHSLRSMLIALTVIVIGLFMLCAHQQAAKTPGEDLSQDDEQFRMELLDMLDLAEQEGDTGQFADETQTAQPQEDDFLSLLSDEDDQSISLFDEDLGIDETEEFIPFQPEETPVLPPQTRQPSTTTPGVYDDIYTELMRLESILEQRSTQVDSLRRIIDNRNARIRDLEARLAAAKSGGVQITSQQRATSSSYTPVTQLSGPFVDKYNEGRARFEAFDYNGCISIMTELLTQYPDHELADNAQYWIGESYYGLNQYQKAILEFQKVFAYDAADKHDDAQLMIGLSYVRLGQREQAQSAFEEFLSTYTDSEYLPIAERHYQNINI